MVVILTRQTTRRPNLVNEVCYGGQAEVLNQHHHVRLTLLHIINLYVFRIAHLNTNSWDEDMIACVANMKAYLDTRLYTHP